jgi:hypothetical protein
MLIQTRRLWALPRHTVAHTRRERSSEPQPTKMVYSSFPTPLAGYFALLRMVQSRFHQRIRSLRRFQDSHSTMVVSRSTSWLLIRTEQQFGNTPSYLIVNLRVVLWRQRSGLLSVDWWFAKGYMLCGIRRNMVYDHIVIRNYYIELHKTVDSFLVRSAMGSCCRW